MDWDLFSNKLEEVVEKRIKPLEKQVCQQEELIRNLAESLQVIQEVIKAKSVRKFQLKPIVPNVKKVEKGSKSAHENPLELEENHGGAIKDEYEGIKNVKN